jgi:type I restriction enzyme S subunit
MRVTLPENWNEARLGQVCHLVNGRAFRPSEWSAVGLPIVRIQNLRDRNASFNRYDGPVEDRHIVHSGDLLFAWSGTPGTSFGAHIWRGDTAVLNQHIFKMSFSSKLFHSQFLKLAINAQLPLLIRKAKGGAGLKHLNKGTVEAIQVPIPPRAEQDRIVAMLDATVGRLSEIREELERLSKVGDDLVSSLLAAAASGRLLDENTIVDSSPTPVVADVPSHWQTVTAREAGEITLGRQRSPEHHFGPTMRPYLRVANVLEDRIDVSDVKMMNFSDGEFEKYRLRYGDILLNEGQSLELVGRPAMFHDEIYDVCYTNTLIRFRCGPKMSPDFAILVFRHLLRSGAFKRIAKITTNLAHLGAQRFANLRIPLPPLDEQLEIAKRCRHGLAVAGNARSRIASFVLDTQQLSAEIEVRALAGMLVEQRPNDEPKPTLLVKPSRPRANVRSETVRAVQADLSTPRSEELTQVQQPLSSVDALSNAGRPLSPQALFAAAGYPDDASVVEVEQFFIELRDALRSGKIARSTLDDRELFELVPGAAR